MSDIKEKRKQEEIEKTKEKVRRLLKERNELCCQELTKKQFLDLFYHETLKFEDLPETTRLRTIRQLHDQAHTIEKYLDTIDLSGKDKAVKTAQSMTRTWSEEEISQYLTKDLKFKGEA